MLWTMSSWARKHQNVFVFIASHTFLVSRRHLRVIPMMTVNMMHTAVDKRRNPRGIMTTHHMAAATHTVVETFQIMVGPVPNKVLVRSISNVDMTGMYRNRNILPVNRK